MGLHNTYDALNRLTDIDYPDDGLNVAFTYDMCTNGRGRLCEMQDGSGTTTYAYDSRGNLATQTATVGGVAQTLVYAYNGADQLIRITYPSGRTVDHARDLLGRITSVTTPLDGVIQTLAGDIEYRLSDRWRHWPTATGSRSAALSIWITGSRPKRRAGCKTSRFASTQTVAWQAHYDPFGRASVTTQAVVYNLRFPGQYFDAETGLHYNYFRDYDPSLGRYIESDPIGLEGGINT